MFLYLGISKNERRILLIGKTGVGKSTTGNTILGKYEFPAAVSSQSITSVTKRGQAERYGRKLVVVDTPGLYDTSVENGDVITEIKKCYGITSPGLHAIVLVVEIGRFTLEENKTVEFFLNRFGKNLEKFLIIAFTYKDKLEREEMTVHDYVNTLPHNSALQKLLNRINNRYVVFGYKGKQQDRENEVQDLLNMIDDIMESNGGNYYTNEVYNEAEKILHERWEEDKKIEKEKHDKEIEEALKPMKEEFEQEWKGMVAEFNQKQEEYKRILEQKEREWQERMRQREVEFREEIRRHSESGSGSFFGKLGGVVGGGLGVAFGGAIGGAIGGTIGLAIGGLFD